MSIAADPASFLPPDLVIFDCDGVLVDSGPIANRVLAEAVTALGRPMTTEDCLRAFEGQHFATVIAGLERALGRPVDETWLPEPRQRTAEAFRRELRPIDGIHEVLAELAAARIATCVASQGPAEKMTVSLGVTGLPPAFAGRIFSAYQVARGKPHPDLFLHAAACLNRPPASCVVVEDSPLGVRAAVAAGMAVFGFDPQGDGQDLAAGGARVFGEMRALPGLLGLS